MVLDSETVCYAIARPLAEVYEFLKEPTNFTKWSFVGDAPMRHIRGRDWAVETSVGSRILRFPTPNAFGVLDHGAMRFEGDRIHPTGLWAVANGAGTELIYTNFRRPEMSDVEWESLKTWIATDFLALQSVLESEGRVEPLYAASIAAYTIKRPAREVYEFLVRPENFAKWAFTGDAHMEDLGNGEWAVETTVGPRVIRFSERNNYGVLTYTSRLSRGGLPHPIPMRVMANGDATELFYLFLQRPGTSDAEWQSVREWVSVDLEALKSLLETDL